MIQGYLNGRQFCDLSSLFLHFYLKQKCRMAWKYDLQYGLEKKSNLNRTCLRKVIGEKRISIQPSNSQQSLKRQGLWQFIKKIALKETFYHVMPDKCSNATACITELLSCSTPYKCHSKNTLLKLYY